MQPIPNHWINITTPEELCFLKEDLEDCSRVAVDTETTGLAVTDEVFGVSFAVGDCKGDKKVRRAYWCNFNFVDETLKQGVLDVVRLLFESGKWNLMFANASFDIRMIRATFEIKLLHENINCTQLLALVLGRWPSVGLKYLTGSVLNRQPVWAKEVNVVKVRMGFKEKDDDFPYTLLPADIVFPYACEDVQNTFDLFYALLPYYKFEQPALQEIYKLERRVARVTAKLEYHGMSVDLEYFKKLHTQLTEELAIEDDYYSQRWGQYKNTHKIMVPSVQSSDRLARIIFDPNYPNGLHKDPELAAKTKGGAISVKMDELAANFPDDEDIQRLAQYVFRKSALEGYVDPIINKHVSWVDDDGNPLPPTIHSSFWQIQATGRFSSSKLNLQNITNDKLATEWEKGYSIRRGFICPPGFLYMAADYKAFEVAILANASQDPKLVHHMVEGVDFHSVVGSLAYHRPYQELRQHVDELARMQRTKIKKTSFAFLYGAGVKKIARTTGISMDEAQAIKNALSKAYPDMMAWWQDTYREAAHEGHVLTLCGRLRRIDPQHAYTVSVNTVCQGTAADIMKYAHADLEVLLQGHKSRQVHTVHDEIHFYLHPDDVDLVPQIVEIMQRRRFDPPKLRGSVYVPMIAELNIGPNWSEMRETTLEHVQEVLREMQNG